MPRYIESYAEVTVDGKSTIFELTERELAGGLLNFVIGCGLNTLKNQVEFPKSTIVSVVLFTHDDGGKLQQVMDFAIKWEKDDKGAAWGRIVGKIPYMVS